MLIDASIRNSKVSRFVFDVMNFKHAQSTMHLLALYLASTTILVGPFRSVACFDLPRTFPSKLTSSVTTSSWSSPVQQNLCRPLNYRCSTLAKQEHESKPITARGWGVPCVQSLQRWDLLLEFRAAVRPTSHDTLFPRFPTGTSSGSDRRVRRAVRPSTASTT